MGLHTHYIFTLQGMYALHWAAKSRCLSVDTVRRVVDAYPLAAQKADQVSAQ